MNITFIRQDSGSGKETLSVCEAGHIVRQNENGNKIGTHYDFARTY